MGLLGGSSKSTAASTQYATDKRQVAYDAPATSVDLHTSGGKNAVTSANIQVFNNLLDGGSISKAFAFADKSRDASFDFAEGALNSLLALAINTEKTAQASAQAVTDTAAQAIGEISKKADAETEQYKNWMLLALLAGGAWLLWKRKN